MHPKASAICIFLRSAGPMPIRFSCCQIYELAALDFCASSSSVSWASAVPALLQFRSILIGVVSTVLGA